MGWILGKARYLVIVAVAATMLASLAAFCVGAWKTWEIGRDLALGGLGNLSSVDFLHLMDAFLIAIVLMVFSTGTWTLFVGDLDIPESGKVRDLQELEARIGSLIVLVMALFMLERFIAGEGGVDLLIQAGSFALVAGAIIAHTFIIKRHREP